MKISINYLWLALTLFLFGLGIVIGYSLAPSSPVSELAPDQGGTMCIQVITMARNQKTGECKDFPTPCDVPKGWEKVRGDKCKVYE